MQKVCAIIYLFCLTSRCFAFSEPVAVFDGIDSSALSISPDGEWVVSGGAIPLDNRNPARILDPRPGLLNVWNVSTKKLSFTRKDTGIRPNSIALSPDGKLLAVGYVPDGFELSSKAGVLRVYSFPTMKELLVDSSSECRSLCFSPDSKLLFYEATKESGDGEFVLWNIEAKKAKLTLSREDCGFRSDSSLSSSSVAWAPNGDTLVIGDVKGVIRAIRLSDCQTTALSPHKSNVRCLAISKDNQIVASVGTDGMLNLSSLDSKQLLISIKAHNPYAMQVALLPSGSFVATSGMRFQNNDRRHEWAIWEVKSGRRAFAVDAHSCPVTCLSMTVDGRWLATGAGDGTVKIWNIPEKYR